jgi:hypothetical protein
MKIQDFKASNYMVQTSKKWWMRKKFCQSQI